MDQKKTIDMLTPDSVSILTQKTVTVDGRTYILDSHRRAYTNSTTGRADITADQPADVVAAVMAMWGDAPTVTELTEERGDT